MALKDLILNAPLRLRLHGIIGAKCYSTEGRNILETAEEEPRYLEEEQDINQLEKQRNKSRLNEHHRNILMGQKPYEESKAWHHDTIKYKKRILGRYGMYALGVPAGLAWPTPEEVEDMKEYERVAYPLSIQERWQKIKEEKKQKEEALIARQKQIQTKMVNMRQLIADVQAKVAKKQAAEEEAKLKKERRIEEIRQQLIAQGSMGKETLEKAVVMAEKDEKKMRKEAKKAKLLEREQRLIKEMSKKFLKQENPDTAEDDAEEKKKE